MEVEIQKCLYDAYTASEAIQDFLKQAINGWRGAISFRNILAHGYDNIDNEIVWGIIETDLSTLINSIKKYMD